MMPFIAMVNRFVTTLGQFIPFAGSIEPVCLLYVALAGTYLAAASAATHEDHKTLARCYAVSAVLHSLIAMCHQLHM